MFEFQYCKGNTEDIKTLPVTDYFESVKLAVIPPFSDPAQFLSKNKMLLGSLTSKGYIRLISPEREDFDRLMYFVKPSQEVHDYFAKTCPSDKMYVDIDGRTNNLIFSVPMGHMSHKAIAGRCDLDELEIFLSTAEVANKLTEEAYAAFRRVHPNFSIKSISEPTGKELDKTMKAARSVFIAASYELKDKDLLIRAKSGEFDRFYLNESHLDFLAETFGIAQKSKEYGYRL
ncbi:hypothetical protein [Vibrio harveyi]|uniref:hypothetical protein n=1 Tax=Vibrio harveyi TaxID=669 RepID=UPI003CF1E2D6